MSLLGYQTIFKDKGLPQDGFQRLTRKEVFALMLSTRARSFLQWSMGSRLLGSLQPSAAPVRFNKVSNWQEVDRKLTCMQSLYVAMRLQGISTTKP